jgi:hypothetical protein
MSGAWCRTGAFPESTSDRTLTAAAGNFFVSLVSNMYPQGINRHAGKALVLI